MARPPSEPARGVMAGVKADLQRAKEGGSTYNPTGVGSAWSHNFLNQKPWHPLNFRNQMRLYEAQQAHTKETKEKEQALQEFNAEQDYLKTLSYLSPEEQQRYKERQSVSFMYMKPPGLEAALEKEKATVKESKVNTAPPAGPSQSVKVAGEADKQVEEARAQHRQDLDRIREDPYAVMLSARLAQVQDQRFEFKRSAWAGSPPRGGLSASDLNQQLLVEDEEGGKGEDAVLMADMALLGDLGPEERALLVSLSPSERRAVVRALVKKRKKAEEEEKLKEATQLLQQEGYDLEELRRSKSKRKEKSSKKSPKKKKKRRRKEERHHRRHEGSEHDKGTSSSS